MIKRKIKLLTNQQLQKKGILINIIGAIFILIAGIGVGMYIVVFFTWGRVPTWIAIMIISITIFNWIVTPINIIMRIRFKRQVQAFNLVQAYKEYEF